jgi:hypothetical protein
MDTSVFRWQRAVEVPAGSGVACAVLDAGVFHDAEPALRDVRLAQDGRELPYAVEESYDTESLASGVTLPEDRSLYEVVTEGAMNSGLNLPAKVPVERVAVADGAGEVHVEASTSDGLNERVAGALRKGVLPVTLGVNLQRDARVTVRATTGKRVRLEMRRRSLCFTPEDGKPVTMYYGAVMHEGEMAGVQYAYSRGFVLPAAFRIARLGNVVANPVFRVQEESRGFDRRVLIAGLVAVVFFFGMSGWMLRRFGR